jgi:mannose-6-phosphate isomerase-like protein (cupin superfamily)
MNEILQYAFDGQGLSRVYENNQWMVGIKNYKPANDIEGIDCVERHNETDELFILLEGECILCTPHEVNAGSPGTGVRPSLDLALNPALELRALRMKPGRVYNIPKGLWHNTVTRSDPKLILVEAASTGSHNCDVLGLTDPQLKSMKGLVPPLWQKI